VPTKAKEPLPTIDEHFTYQPTAPPQPIAPVFTNSMSSMHVGSNGMASIYPSSASLPYSTYDSQSWGENGCRKYLCEQIQFSILKFKYGFFSNDYYFYFESFLMFFSNFGKLIV